jgi:hypothetical protein
VKSERSKKRKSQQVKSGKRKATKVKSSTKSVKPKTQKQQNQKGSIHKVTNMHKIYTGGWSQLVATGSYQKVGVRASERVIELGLGGKREAGRGRWRERGGKEAGGRREDGRKQTEGDGKEARNRSFLEGGDYLVA